MKTTYIFGHKNPDTDAVTASISLAYLKNKLGMNSEARILSEINKETKYVLKRFNFEVPKFLNDVKIQIEDISYRHDIMMNESASIYDAYTYMVDNSLTGLPIVKDTNKFIGYVSLKEIATDFIRGDFDSLNSYYDNILKVLDGSVVLRFNDIIQGKITAVTFSSELFISDVDVNENSIIIVGNRPHVIDYCIKNKVKLIILVGNQELSSSELEEAKKNKVNIIKTNKYAFEVCKLIGLSNHISTILKNSTPVIFKPEDYLTDFIEVSNKLKHTNYPIVNGEGECVGMLRLTDINNYAKKEVILVDHNEIKQSAVGLNEASILEIVDHHNIGSITTPNPISCRIMGVGSSNTIIYRLYKEANILIPKDIASIMLSGILSDTLILKSPTTTDIDRETVQELANIAGLNYEEYGMEMLKAGSSLDGLSIEDVVYYDYKDFEIDGKSFGIGQILTLDYEQVLNKKDDYIEFLNKACETKGFKLMALFVTDIVRNGSYVLYSTHSEKIMKNAFGEEITEGYYLDGLISRKKQMLPNIMSEIENME